MGGIYGNYPLRGVSPAGRARAQGEALVVDTGASCTAIDAAILAPLGLMPTGQIAIHPPSTQGLPHACNQYDVGLSIYGAASEIVYLNTALPIIEGQFKAQGIDGLLGRDVLALTRFTYLGHDS
jgi:hypothetical protein